MKTHRRRPMTPELHGSRRGGAWFAAAAIAGAFVGLAALRVEAVAAPPPEVVEPRLALEVNLPAYRLSVLVDSEVVEEYTVCVGAPSYSTPVGSFAITRLVWNPWWHPPSSRWAAGRAATPPGPSNPMGRVKLYFRDLYYVHGTGDVSSLGCAASHGCLRMSNSDAVDLARRVHLAGVPDADRTEIERLAETPSATRDVPLDRPVPLEIVYRVAEVRRGELLLHPDIYRRERVGHGAAVEAALHDAGRTVAAEDPELIAALAALAPRPGEPTVTIPLAELP